MFGERGREGGILTGWVESGIGAYMRRLSCLYCSMTRGFGCRQWEENKTHYILIIWYWYLIDKVVNFYIFIYLGINSSFYLEREKKKKKAPIIIIFEDSILQMNKLRYSLGFWGWKDSGTILLLTQQVLTETPKKIKNKKRADKSISNTCILQKHNIYLLMFVYHQ